MCAILFFFKYFGFTSNIAFSLLFFNFSALFIVLVRVYSLINWSAVVLNLKCHPLSKLYLFNKWNEENLRHLAGKIVSLFFLQIWAQSSTMYDFSSSGILILISTLGGRSSQFLSKLLTSLTYLGPVLLFCLHSSIRCLQVYLNQKVKNLSHLLVKPVFRSEGGTRPLSPPASLA